jgi:hypothetical protein
LGSLTEAFEVHLIFFMYPADDFPRPTRERDPSADGERITMPAKDINASMPGLDVKEILHELEVPFSPDQVQWRVTVKANDRKRGQIVSYADPRAYTDRLNVLFSLQGWNRGYRVETMSNITRIKKGESILSGKVFVICTVTISGLWSHSGTGDAWADDDNGMTSADAQAFKRACSCFGLGRYFYDFLAIWVDLDHKGQPVKPPVLSAWALPENWRKGLRPPGRNGEAKPEVQGEGSKSDNAAGTDQFSVNLPTVTVRRAGRLTGSERRIRATSLISAFWGWRKSSELGSTGTSSRVRAGQPTEADPRCSHKTKSAGDAGGGRTRD